MLLLYLCLPTLVQFLHRITAILKRHDKATLESELTSLEFAKLRKKNGWHLKLHVRNMLSNLQELSPNRKRNFNQMLSRILAFSGWL